MTVRRSQTSRGVPAEKRSLVARIKQQAQQVSTDLLGLLFPSRCAGCGRVDEELCPVCRAGFAPLEPPTCARCGRGVEGDFDLCVFCQHQEPLFVEGRAIYRFEGALRTAVHALKYEGRAAIAPILAEAMLSTIQTRLPECESWPLDLAVAVPLHPAREKERGYNQTRLLLDTLATLWNLPVDNAAVERTRDTRPQVGLNMHERRDNVQGAFVAGPVVLGADVLLVDDVRTTGATLAACTGALLEAGAHSVRVLALAEAV